MVKSKLIKSPLINKKYSDKEIYNILHPYVKEWFQSKFSKFCLPQKYAVMPIHCRENILVSASTGSGKTLTAFLSILNELIDSSEKQILEDRVYCVYVSPLKALNRDVSVNLLEPLSEISKIANKDLGIRVAVRTGDTTTSERTKMLKNPPHILITTPESLGIMLCSPKFRDHLMDVQWFIADEIHALAENKRGVHLSLSMERLAHLSNHMTRIGLSATVAPLDEIAKFLVGSQRDCKIVDVQFMKEMDLKVVSAVPDLINVSHEDLHDALYNKMHELIQKHKTTLVFTNTRAATERVVDYLKNKFPKSYYENIGAHHGSLSAEHRRKLEKNLRDGKLKCVVCLDGDTRILDSKGQWVKIKNIEKTSVQSINNQLQLNNNKILNIFKTKNNKNLLKLNTEFGKEINCTKNHKFLTLDENGSLCWKEAFELLEGEFIATVRRYDYEKFSKNEIKLFLYDKYPEAYFVSLKTSFLDLLRKKTKNLCGTYKSFWSKYLKDQISYSTFLSNIWGRYMFKIKTLRAMSKLLLMDEMKIFNSIISVSSSKYKMDKPEINNDFVRLLAFMLADGYLSKRDFFVTNKNKDLLNYYYEIIGKLSSKDPFYKIGSTGTPILVWSSKFFVGLVNNLGCRLGRKARIVEIPNFIFRLDSKLIFSFLSGYFDGDGYVEKKQDGRIYAAGFSTTSKRMAEDISRLLLRENILSSIRSRYYDEIQTLKNSREIVKKGWFYDVVILGGGNLRSFAKKISPIRKNLKEIKKVIQTNGYTNKDVIPNIGAKVRALRHKTGISTYKLQKIGLNPVKYELGTRFISRKQLRRILNLYQSEDPLSSNLSKSDLLWEKVKTISEIKPQKYVYNIEVGSDHNYIANGFLTKNCSTSLELGIDIGFIDLVICLGSPKSVARALQRIGRSGHQLHSTTKGRIIVMDRDDLVECSVLLKSAVEKKIDRIHLPRNALDVLAQHIYGMAIEQVWDEKELLKTIRKSYCYSDLDASDFQEVLSYLAGEFASLEDRYIYAKIWRKEGKIGRRGRLARVIYMTNIGTIPDQTGVTVKIGNIPVGTLDEGFLERLKPGDVFVLGGSTYLFKYAKGMVAFVQATADRPPTVPSWVSEMLPLSFDLANEIGKFRRLVEDKFKNRVPKKDIIKFINDYLYVDDNASNAMYQYFFEQFNYVKEIPNDKKILVENYTDEQGNKKVVFHSMFGRRVNDVLSRAIAYSVSRSQHKDVEIGLNDKGFYLGVGKGVQIMKAIKLIKANELRQVMDNAIEDSEVLKRRFRHCANRSLMILRNYMGKTKRVGRQQVSSMILMSAVKRISPDFSILKEARREVLEDLMDIDNAMIVMEAIEKGKIKLVEISTQIPSPFAFNIALQGIMDIVKMEDKMEFLQRMHQMVLAKILLDKNVKKSKSYVDIDQFSYQKHWKEEEDKKRQEKEEYEEKLKGMLFDVSKKIDLNANIVYDIKCLIEGDRKGFKKDFIGWLDELLKGPVDDNWPKELMEFLKEAKERII